MEQIIIVTVVALISSLITYLIASKINKANSNIYIEQARAKAKVIEHEAQSLLKESRGRAKRDYEREYNTTKKDFEYENEKIEKNKNEIKNLNIEVKALKDGLEAQHKEYKDKTKQAIKILENASGLTKEEAKELMFEKVKEDSRAEVSSIFRKEYKQVQKDSKLEINNILSHAVTRYAGEFAAERLTNNIALKDEETKGKIIGKEGRNIKTLEMTTGVDIIIGDIPNTIVVSSFNLYRRAIATKTIEELIADGRIQPARIEEVYNSIKSEFDKIFLKRVKIH